MARFSFAAIAAMLLGLGCKPLCTPAGHQSVNDDGSDCCGAYDSNTNSCGSTSCVASGTGLLFR